MTNVSLLGAFAVVAGLAWFVWRARPQDPVNRWFGAYTTLMAAWILGIAGLHSGVYLDAWGRFTFASASLIPAAFLAFTRSYPTQSRWPSVHVITAALALGTAFSLLSLATPLLVYDVTMTPEGLSRKTGVLYPAFSGYFLTTWVAALSVFILKWRRARGRERAQLQYLGFGLVISGIGGIGVNLILPIATGRSTYAAFGPYFVLVLVALVGHAIIRHRLMDLRLVLNRGLANLVFAALLSFVVMVVGRLLFNRWDQSKIILSADLLVFAAIGLCMLTKPAQQLVGSLIDPYLYRGRVDHDSALREATLRLSYLRQPKELAEELRRILETAFVPESFAMAARPLEGGTLEELSAITPDITDLLAVTALTLDRPSATVHLVNPQTAAPSKQFAHETLRRAGVEVVMTLARRDQLLGAVLLGPRRSGDPYFTRDLAFIEALARLASIALENALLYRQRIQMLEYADRLLESLNSAVVAIDVTGNITSYNPAAQILLGLADTRSTQSLSALPSEISWALALAISRLWVPREIEVSIDHSARGLLPVILSAAVLLDDSRRTVGALVVVTDLSTVKALERNQRRMEHFATMARFYAGLAHEIRSPLAAISNFVSMLPDRFADPEYRDTAVRLLPGEVARIVRLADRLRLMAPSEDGTLVPLALPPLLADIVAIHAPSPETTAIKVTLLCPENLPPIKGDASQLIQLFVNLLKNAAEAMPQGGTVTIEAFHSAMPAGAGSIVVRVIDEGVGIDTAVRSKVFQPFFTTKPAGTGLGLSICREIADFHHAQLALWPRTGRRGTVAEIRFPASSVATERDADRIITPSVSRS